MRGRSALPVLAALAVAGGVALARRKPTLETHARDLTGAPFPLRSTARRIGQPAASARVVPPSWEPRPVTALGAWEPVAPRTAAGRAAAYAWAAPLTMGGLVLGAASGVRPHVVHGAVVFPQARGVPGATLRSRRFAAAALGHVVIAAGHPGPRVLAHELVHVRQAERLGPLLAPLYLVLLAVYGYARHPLERAPRAAARRAARDAASEGRA